jgi:hypothetical protein
MKVPEYILRIGTRVVTHARLGSTRGFIVAQKLLEARRPSALGLIWGVVGGHGGDVYWVKHDDGTGAAYMSDEFELVVSDAARAWEASG